MIWMMISLLIVAALVAANSSQKENRNRKLPQHESSLQSDTWKKMAEEINRRQRDDLREKVTDIGISSLTTMGTSMEEKADTINIILEGFDENLPADESRAAKYDMLYQAYDKLIKRASLLQANEAEKYFSAKLEEIKQKEEIGKEDYSELIRFMSA